MLKCNLAILLAERNLKITKVSKDTGISRTTLTSLYYNNAKGIQFETLNTLCQYLSVYPDSLLQYLPIEVIINDISKYGLTSSNKILLECTFIHKSHKENSYLLGSITDYKGYKAINIGLLNQNDDIIEQSRNKMILSIFNKIPSDFKMIITCDILDKLIERKILDKEDIPNSVFIWDDDLDEFYENNGNHLGKGLSAIFGNDIDTILDNLKDPND